MTQKLEGTILLDGLIEGRLPALPGTEQKLRQWVESSADQGLRFSLELDGSSFSVLAGREPLPAEPLGADPTRQISNIVRDLLKIFPPNEKSAVFSTLRSVEYRPGAELQTLYAIAPGGDVLVKSRSIDAHTTPPAPPLTRQQRMRIRLTTLVAALVVIGISTLFIPYRSIFGGIRDHLASVDAANFPIDSTAFDGYFTIERRSADPDGRGLVLVLKRTDNFPRRESATMPTTQSTTAPVTDLQRLARDSLVRGYVRCEYFGDKDAFLGYGEVRIKPLADQETLELKIPLSGDPRPKRIVLTY